MRVAARERAPTRDSLHPDAGPNSAHLSVSLGGRRVHTHFICTAMVATLRSPTVLIDAALSSMVVLSVVNVVSLATCKYDSCQNKTLTFKLVQ
jgi:hypothetical protein